MGKQRQTDVEKLLKKHREKPTPTIIDRRQITLWDHLKEAGFAKLDAAIKKAKRGAA
jgi:hypothetical protein